MILLLFQPVDIYKLNLVLLKKTYQKSLSEILNAIGLLGAKLIFHLVIVFCSRIFNFSLNIQNLLRNTLLTIFEWKLYNK